jgi:hypothetical protein
MLADGRPRWDTKVVALEAIMMMSLPDRVQHINIMLGEQGLQWIVNVHIKDIVGPITIIEALRPDIREFPIKNVLDKIRAFL